VKIVVQFSEYTKNHGIEHYKDEFMICRLYLKRKKEERKEERGRERGREGGFRRKKIPLPQFHCFSQFSI
jgi:hypothetical protein